MWLQAVRVDSERYTPTSAGLPRFLDYTHKSSCPFLPHPEPEPTSYEWTKLIHPNGTVYWYNQGWRTVLANHAYDLTDRDQRQRLMDTMEALWDNIHPVFSVTVAPSTSVDPDVRTDYELFIDIDHRSSDSPVRYYFVDWSCRSVFWRQPMSLCNAISREHLAAKLTTQFWMHVAAYPMHHALPSRAREELRSIVGFYLIDSISFSGSTAPWTRQDMRLILSSLKQDRGRSMDFEPHYLGEETGISNAGIARLWREVCEARALNFYGDPRAKISRFERHSPDKESVHSAIAKTICSIMFLNRPHRLEIDLRELFADGTLYRMHWRTYVEKEIEPEWQQQGTLATIMLAANMAFLALDSVGNGDAGPLLACKTLSLSSTTFSVGALLATLKLARTHHKLKSATVDEANDYMAHCSERMLGLFGLAMVYSIPFTMFMWSLFTFVAAVLLYAFQHWTREAGIPLITATVIPIVSLLVWEWWFFEGRPRRDTRTTSERAEIHTAMAADPAHHHSTGNTFSRRNMAPLIAAFTPAYGRGRGKKRLQVDVEMEAPATPNDSEHSTSPAW